MKGISEGLTIRRLASLRHYGFCVALVFTADGMHEGDGLKSETFRVSRRARSRRMLGFTNATAEGVRVRVEARGRLKMTCTVMASSLLTHGCYHRSQGISQR